MKNKKWLLVVISCMALLTGCNKSLSPKETILKASGNVGSINNVAMKVTMNVGVKSEGIEMAMPVVIDAKIDNKNQTTKMAMGMELFGFKVNVDSYTKVTDDEIINYTKDMKTNTWTKKVQKSSDKNKSEVKDFATIIEKGTKFEKVKSSDKNTIEYKVIIDKETFNELMKNNSELNDSNLKITKDIEYNIQIDSKTNQLKRIYCNLLDNIDKTEDVEYTKLDLEILLTDYNKVGDVKIPEDIIKNAIAK